MSSRYEGILEKLPLPLSDSKSQRDRRVVSANTSKFRLRQACSNVNNPLKHLLYVESDIWLLSNTLFGNSESSLGYMQKHLAVMVCHPG